MIDWHEMTENLKKWLKTIIDSRATNDMNQLKIFDKRKQKFRRTKNKEKGCSSPNRLHSPQRTISSEKGPDP